MLLIINGLVASHSTATAIWFSGGCLGVGGFAKLRRADHFARLIVNSMDWPCVCGSDTLTHLVADLTGNQLDGIVTGTGETVLTALNNGFLDFEVAEA